MSTPNHGLAGTSSVPLRGKSKNRVGAEGRTLEVPAMKIQEKLTSQQLITAIKQGAENEDPAFCFLREGRVFIHLQNEKRRHEWWIEVNPVGRPDNTYRELLYRRKNETPTDWLWRDIRPTHRPFYEIESLWPDLIIQEALNRDEFYLQYLKYFL